MARMNSIVTLDRSYIAASKQFTDRTGFIEAFNIALKEIQEYDTKVLTYYGIGGIGKSSLRKELQLQTNKSEKDVKWISIDFKVKQHRLMDNALIYMRTELSKKYKMRFPLFDFAYAYYLKKVSPHIPLNNDSIPFLEQGELLSDVILTFEDIPMINIATSISKVIEKSYKFYRDWKTQKKLNQINDMYLMEANELYEKLPLYFIEDINNFLKDTKNQMIIFMDTYEALWDGDKNKYRQFETDEWIRDILVRNLPGVLFVVFGREKLRWESLDKQWEDCIEQHLIGKLDPKDSKLFLESCNIYEDEIINRIIEISGGLPYSLDLCVDTYYAIKKNRPPVVEDFNFQDNQNKIFERFMSHLEESERETLKALSITRYWDSEIFKAIVKEYNTGYSILKVNELSYFSFIDEMTIKDTWEMNSLMRTSLQECQTEKQRKEIHRFLFNYYSEKLKYANSNIPNQEYLNESYYHGKNSIELQEFSEWFIENSRIYIKSGHMLFLAKLFQDLYDEIDRLQSESFKIDSFPQICYTLGEIYMYTGNYIKAENILQTDISTNDLDIKARIKGLLATLQAKTYKYKLADINFKKSLNILQEIDLTDKDISNSIYKIKILIDYGKLKVYTSENSSAIDLYNKAIYEINTLLTDDKQKYTLLNLKATALEKLGEVNSVMKNYELSKTLYKEAIEIYEKINDKYSVCLEEEGNLIYLMNNKGLLYKRLAENNIKHKEFKEAIDNYKNALQTYNKSIEISPENVDTFKKLGFASRGLLRLLVNNDINKHEIDDILNQTIQFFDSAIELSPRDVSAIYSKGGVYRIMAKHYEKTADYKKIIKLQDMSIEQANKAISIQPDYVYAYNGKTDSLVAKADIAIIEGKNDEALLLYNESIKTIEQLLIRTPKNKNALKRAKSIENKINRLKCD